MTRQIEVIRDWRASYDDPITLAQGEALSLSGRSDVWDGHRWLWAVGDDGREGWIPDTLVTQSRDGPVARDGYTALELSCKTGDLLELLQQTHGWAFCRDAAHAEGWVPLSHLRF